MCINWCATSIRWMDLYGPTQKQVHIPIRFMWLTVGIYIYTIYSSHTADLRRSDSGSVLKEARQRLLSAVLLWKCVTSRWTREALPQHHWECYCWWRCTLCRAQHPWGDWNHFLTFIHRSERTKWSPNRPPRKLGWLPSFCWVQGWLRAKVNSRDAFVHISLYIYIHVCMMMCSLRPMRSLTFLTFSPSPGRLAHVDVTAGDPYRKHTQMHTELPRLCWSAYQM